MGEFKTDEAEDEVVPWMCPVALMPQQILAINWEVYVMWALECCSLFCTTCWAMNSGFWLFSLKKMSEVLFCKCLAYFDIGHLWVLKEKKITFLGRVLILLAFSQEIKRKGKEIKEINSAFCNYYNYVAKPNKNKTPNILRKILQIRDKEECSKRGFGTWPSTTKKQGVPYYTSLYYSILVRKSYVMIFG